MTVAPLPICQENDDLDFNVRRACKYIAKAMVLAKQQQLHEYAAVLNGAMRLTEANEFTAPRVPTSGR